MARYTVTVHERGRRRSDDHPDLDTALVALAAAVHERRGVRRDTAQAFTREVAPEEQVAARVEVRGPRVSGGVDVRGDGSDVAFTGRWVRRPVEPAGRETAPQALRRVLEARASE